MTQKANAKRQRLPSARRGRWPASPSPLQGTPPCPRKASSSHPPGLAPHWPLLIPLSTHPPRDRGTSKGAAEGPQPERHMGGTGLPEDTGEEAGPGERLTRSPSPCWLRNGAVGPRGQTRPQCLGEGGRGVGGGFLLGKKPPFSGSRATGRRRRLRGGLQERASSSPRPLPNAPLMGLREYCKCLRTQPPAAVQMPWSG